MKRKLLLITLMVALFVCLFVISASAMDYVYVDESGNEYLRTTVDDTTGIITSYSGTKFPMWDDQNNPLCWYLISEEGSTKTVKSFVSTDPAYTNHGGGYFRFVKASDFKVEGYPVPTKQNIVSINMPNDTGITAFSDYSQVGIYANTGDYKPENTELLFARFPNTLTNSSRLVQATTVLEVYFDENTSNLTTISEVAFHGCWSLRKVQIPASVQTIRGINSSNGTAFYRCYSLESLTFQQGSQLNTLGDQVFLDCKALTEVYFPNTLENIGKNIFEGATSLKKLSLGASCKNLTQSLTYRTFVQYMYVPNTIETSTGTHNFWSGSINGVASPKSVVFFAGTLEEAKALNDLIGNNDNQKFWTSDYSNMIAWDPTMSDDEYVAKAATDGKNYVVYGYNKCEAFYNGIHTEKLEEGEVDTNPCVITLCAKCNGTGFDTSSDSTHDIKTVIAYVNGFNVSGTKTTSCQHEGCVYNTSESAQPVAVGAIFTGFGISTRIDDGTDVRGIVFTMLIDKDLLASYEESAGTRLGYGVLATFATVIGESNPLNNTGAPILDNGIIATNIANTGVYAIDLVIKGTKALWEEQAYELDLYMLGYTVENNVVTYMGTVDGVETASTSVSALNTTTYKDNYVA